MLREYFYNLASEKVNSVFASFVKFILFLLSLVYSLAVKFIFYAYKSNILRTYYLNCKVISVGNITWGGTGKTPIVEMIANKLIKEGRKVAIQSRGYKRKKTPQNSRLETADYRTMGDEPFMLQENLNEIPVIVGKNRVLEAKLALERLNLDVVILDDGFQHWKLFRDLDIVAIDATNPFGKGFLIPRGILREPLKGLKRADIFLLTHTDSAKDNLNSLIQRLEEINPKAEIFESIHSPIGFYNILDTQKKIINTNLIKGKKIGIVTAIGNPASFKESVLNLGLNVSLKFIFLDHHEFSQDDFDRIITSCLKEGLSTLVTTAKDATRLRKYCLDFRDVDILVLRIEIKITKNEDKFFNRLFSLY
ncbi:MAG: tetraacyldisaccharide 4'-kinase [Candidatus Omnitrophota bacterium]|nr:tetraacyldisaccharide 4'-kinase [Candidatus Omnitrophota bacterium]